MTAAARLYVGRTVHRRFSPRPHRFSYAIFQLLLDVDRLDEAFAGLRLARLGRLGLISFDPRDHGARDGGALRPWVEARLAAAGVDRQRGAHPAFDLSPRLGLRVQPAVDRLRPRWRRSPGGGDLRGQQHFRPDPRLCDAGEGRAVENQTADKAFYVSPFFRVEGGYRFRLSTPAARFNLVIAKDIQGQTDFIASLSAHQRPLTDANLLRLSLTMPLMTLHVVAAIHWEALRLWIKGAPFGGRPAGPKAGMSVGRTGLARR